MVIGHIGISSLHLLQDGVRWLESAKPELKTWFTDHGLAGEWTVLRDIIFNPGFYLNLVIPFVVLERFFYVSRRKKWLTANVRLDYLYPVLNALVFGALSAAIVTGIKAFYASRLPFLNTGLLDGRPIWLQALGAFLITDFTFFFSHYIRHKVRWLWFFHAIHHSQRDLNPLTVNRHHPFEHVVNVAVRTIPIAFIGGSYPMWLWFTVINDMWGYVIHSNTRINLGWWGKVFVSPQYHRVHHSRDQRHYDMNFGERLVIWDTLFGTRYDNYDEYPETGVDDLPDESGAHGAGGILAAWANQIAYPFRMIWRSANQTARRTAVYLFRST